MSTFDIVLEFINEKVWLSVFIAVLYVHSCPRKPHFSLKFACGALGLVILGLLPRILFEYVTQSSVLLFWLSRELFLWPMILALYMGVMFRCDWNMMLLSAICGLCAQETVFGLWAMLSVNIPWIDTNVGELFLCALMGLGVTVVLYNFLAKRITPRSLQALQKRSLIPLLALYILSALLISFSSYVVLSVILFFDQIRDAFAAAGVPIHVAQLRMYSICTSTAADVLVLLALSNMLRYSESELERVLLEQIREQDRKQYARFRNNVDYINTKSHDLRHYLDLIRHNQTIPKEELELVSESLSQLDSETDSGNETLDLILTDRRLTCKKEGGELIFQTDGTTLEQLDIVDTFGVFCNILDNAIEYIRELPAEKRTIRLGIRTVHSMVFIHQENFLAGELEMKDGLPVTTKEDRSRHGLGLKSVQDTIKKRGGELLVHAVGNRFEIDIYFPIAG